MKVAEVVRLLGATGMRPIPHLHAMGWSRQEKPLAEWRCPLHRALIPLACTVVCSSGFAAGNRVTMNYFTHGLRFTDRPYYLVGTALPDMLSVVDRQVRLRSKRVAPFADGTGTVQAELAAGVLQHLDDDAWFHNTPAFLLVTGQLTRLFRELLPADDGYRPALLGHIVMELLLDGVLIRANPGMLDAYYAAFSAIDPHVV